jgi:hypothetical protein
MLAGRGRSVSAQVSTGAMEDELQRGQLGGWGLSEIHPLLPAARVPSWLLFFSPDDAKPAPAWRSRHWRQGVQGGKEGGDGGSELGVVVAAQCQFRSMQGSVPHLSDVTHSQPSLQCSVSGRQSAAG